MATCAPCHGGASGDRIINHAARSQVFFQLNPDGTVKLDGNGAPLFLTDHQNDELLNIGISFGTYLREIPRSSAGSPAPRASRSRTTGSASTPARAARR